MTAPLPPTIPDLTGISTMRGVTIMAPTNEVARLLPPGLELGPQTLTSDARSHPVLLFFNDIFRANLSAPTLLPNMTYHEFHVGIPYTYLAGGPARPGVNGPYYFMPRLCLDSWQPIIGGIVFWGFAKEPATVRVTADNYSVVSLAGEPVASLSWKQEERRWQRIAEYAHFEPIRQILDQTLICRAPASVGPFFSLSDFRKEWSLGSLAPLQIGLEIESQRLGEVAAGRFNIDRWSPGIDTSSLGSYALRIPWRLSFPYPAGFPSGWRFR